jgi:SagB-type dehydrogenase family enzyme
MVKVITLAMVPAILVGGAALAVSVEKQVLSKEAREASEKPIALPPPTLKGEISLEEVLARRRSAREFKPTPLTRNELAQLLWAAQGVTDSRGYRTAPSAGALYPLDLYVVTAEGCFYYDPKGHRLSRRVKRDLRTDLWKAALRQDSVREAPAVFVIAAVYERTERRYGKVRSPRYVHLEAGHAAQNLLLQAVGLDLGAVPIGAFQDEEVQKVLGLGRAQKPLYLIPVGPL